MDLSSARRHFVSSPQLTDFPTRPVVPCIQWQTAKSLLKKNDDPYLALLAYRSSPLQNGLSPSELLMGRKLRTQLPTLPATLKPQASKHDLTKVREKEEEYRANQQKTFNNRHKAKEQSTLQPGDQVWLKDQQRQGHIIKRAPEPRSYLVKTPNGTVRRNRSALVGLHEQQPDEDNAPAQADQRSQPTTPLLPS